MNNLFKTHLHHEWSEMFYQVKKITYAIAYWNKPLEQRRTSDVYQDWIAIVGESNFPTSVDRQDKKNDLNMLLEAF